MGSRYSKVQSTLFNSDKFRKLNDFEKNVYTYLLISPHGNSAGLYRLPEGYATTDIDCSAQRYRNAIKKITDVGLIAVDGDLIFIKQFLRWNPYSSWKHTKGSVKEVKEFMDSYLYELFIKDVKEFCGDYYKEFPGVKKTIDTQSIPYRYPIDTESNYLDRDIYQNKDRDRDGDRKELQPPETNLRDPDVKAIVKYFESNIHGPMAPTEQERVMPWLDKLPRQAIEYAITEAVIHSAKNVAYIESILRSIPDTVKTPEDFRDYLESKEKKRQKRKSGNPFLDMLDRETTDG